MHVSPCVEPSAQGAVGTCMVSMTYHKLAQLLRNVMHIDRMDVEIAARGREIYAAADAKSGDSGMATSH